MTFDLPEELQPFLDDITLSLSVVANSPSRVQKAAVNLQGVYRQHYNNVCRKYLQANTRTLQSQPETHTQRLNAIRRRYETEFQQRLSRMQGQYLATSQREQRSLPKRTPFNAEYTPLLEKYFEYNAFPPLRDREWLARKSMMTPRQIEVWFQNHRRRARNEGRRLERIPMDRIPVEISLDSLEETMAPFLAPKSKRSPSVHRRLTPPINSSHPRPEQMSASTSITTVLDAVSPPSYAFPTKFCPSSQNRDQTFPCKPSDFGLCAEGRTGKPTSKLRKKTCSMAAICDSLLVTRIAGPPIETESESPWHASRCIGHIVAPHPALVQTPAPSASQPSPASATTTHAHCRSAPKTSVRHRDFTPYYLPSALPSRALSRSSSNSSMSSVSSFTGPMTPENWQNPTLPLIQGDDEPSPSPQFLSRAPAGVLATAFDAYALSPVSLVPGKLASS
ncbi:homeodomain type 2 mating protein a2-1 [Coprinopsis cinerea okayama7|uniref:Homeodomain type 2 mating protein a2-1 n=1 Tax=Coprinopsis cinerea (strain Okayama-7 / 130 / ATCC MYA-4618 / FGSC 9003) TaxID=240176 RepID=A8N2T1_COPC7|nr:homeodomain type 2 mating protein a2-1 [Coprinopsis cinerea okayama7\|eukprot:XP_001829153.1 homeodomain type 2 mating protein a2-1 [Coprinopsis cinerea okayama7\